MLSKWQKNSIVPLTWNIHVSCITLFFSGQNIAYSIHLHVRHNKAILRSLRYIRYILYWHNSFFFSFHLRKNFPLWVKSDANFFQCCIETLGSTSVKSGLCPSINITTVKSSSAAFLQANRLCGPRKTDSRENSTSI